MFTVYCFWYLHENTPNIDLVYTVGTKMARIKYLVWHALGRMYSFVCNIEYPPNI